MTRKGVQRLRPEEMSIIHLSIFKTVILINIRRLDIALQPTFMCDKPREELCSTF